MKKVRKSRVDSTYELTKTAQAGANKISVPKHITLTKSEMLFFKSIVAETHKSEWTDHKLTIAAFLARIMSELEAQQNLVRKEGYVIDHQDSKGVVIKKANPRARIIDMYCSQMLSLRRTLAIHNRALYGEARDVARQRGVNRLLDDDEDNDELFASPKTVQ